METKLNKSISLQKEIIEANGAKRNCLNKPSIAFFAQRQSSFAEFSLKCIPYRMVRLNQGNSFDKNTGMFTAPINGIYYFYFTGR